MVEDVIIEVERRLDERFNRRFEGKVYEFTVVLSLLLKMLYLGFCPLLLVLLRDVSVKLKEI